MPRKPTEVNEDAVNLLRRFIKIKSNLGCGSYAEIQLLHDQVLKSTGTYISVQTLSRLLGLVRSNFRPSMHTLDTLSRFVNYYSFNDFQKLQDRKDHIEDDKLDFISTFFQSLFSGIPAQADSTHYGILNNVLQWMRAQPQFTSDIYIALSSTAFGRRLFFQELVNVDCLNNGFGVGLHYYLLHTNDRQEQLMAHSLNCFRYFINDDQVKFKNCFKYIQEYSSSEINSYHPAVIDRFYAALIYNKAVDPKPDPIFDKLLNEISQLTPFTISKTNSFFYVGEAYLLTGDFGRAWDIFGICSIKDLHIIKDARQDRMIQLQVFRLVSGYLADAFSLNKAMAMDTELSGVKLPFLQHDYLSLFILSIKYKMSIKSRAKKIYQESFHQTLEKTKFHYFCRFFKLLGEPEEAKKISKVVTTG